MIRNIYAWLILLIQLWAVFYFFQVSCWEKAGNLQKFRSRCSKIFVGILIFLVFLRSGVQYLWQWKTSVCKMLVKIKVVPVKSDHFPLQKFEIAWISANEWVSVLAQFLLKETGLCISYKLIAWLIPNWIWYDLLAVSHFWPSNHQISHFFCIY